jgi:phosphonopyruvate decarboxylase
MIDMNDALALIEKRREDSIVVPTMTAGRGWGAISQDESLDLPVSGAMGKASSIALGLCLAQPDRKVVLFDGDGSLVMNLGSMVTISGQAPTNLYHFVLENDVYAITGGQPIPNAGKFSFDGLAAASGYASTFEFDDFEEFATRIDEVFDATGPVFITLKTRPEIMDGPVDSRTSARRTPQAARELHDTLNG